LDIHGTYTFHPQDLVGLHFLSPYPKEFLLNETKPYTTSRCSQHRHSRLMQKLIQTLKHSFTKEHPMDDFGKQQDES
jgi:hypothetical protein